MRSFEARDRLVAKALDVAQDRLEIDPANPNADAQAEYNEDGLADAARVFVASLGAERGEPGGLMARLDDLGADDALKAEVAAMMDGLRQIGKFARDRAHQSPEIARRLLPA